MEQRKVRIQKSESTQQSIITLGKWDKQLNYSVQITDDNKNVYIDIKSKFSVTYFRHNVLTKWWNENTA